MDTLYINAKRINDTSLEIDLETLLVISVFKLCDVGNVKLVVALKEDVDAPAFHTTLSNFDVFQTPDAIVTYVKWPALHCVEPCCVVAGICSVARQLIKSSQDESSQFLLGFRESCLAACSESSIWTKFCEVDMVFTVKSLISEGKIPESAKLVDDLVRFEYHMQQPVRMHNIYKVARERQGDFTINSSTAIRDLKIPHCYAEGPYMTLADVILLPSVEILCAFYSEDVFKEHLPLTYEWLVKIREHEKYRLFDLQLQNIPLSQKMKSISINENIKRESLYSADRTRYSPKSRIFTRQNDIDNALNTIGNANIPIETSTQPFGINQPYDWNLVPTILRPDGGAVPKKRSERKMEQLENMVKAVIEILRKQNSDCLKIVDFCSGSGHLGLLLASLLPTCVIILVENKEKSLERAHDRIKQTKLRNVVVLQSNLDYFNARFDIGVSLHACGVATDLVMQNCIENQAHFVCCPCCYGGIHDCYHLKFPRSSNFVQNVSISDYLNIAHASDQTHDKENAKTAQGYNCMNIIDTDRKLYAISCGYEVHLGKLYPETCTPKNNLLVGICKDSKTLKK